MLKRTRSSRAHFNLEALLTQLAIVQAAAETVPAAETTMQVFVDMWRDRKTCMGLTATSEPGSDLVGNVSLSDLRALTADKLSLLSGPIGAFVLAIRGYTPPEVRAWGLVLLSPCLGPFLACYCLFLTDRCASSLRPELACAVLCLPTAKLLMQGSVRVHQNRFSAMLQGGSVNWSEALRAVPVHIVTPSTRFEQVLELLVVHKLHRAYVHDDKEHAIGVITLTDVLRQLLPKVEETPTDGPAMGARC